MSDPLPRPENPGVDTTIKAGTPPTSGLADAPISRLAYQSVSGWAIAGFALGSLFTLLVVICAAIAFYQGAPFFFRQWIFGLAILGACVSLYGQRHVRSSEGALTGARLAQWGFRLSVISGLMYASFYFVTGYAVTRQANAFLMEDGEDAGFFPHLRKGGLDPVELNRAFLLTQPPNTRNGRPEDEKSMIKNYDIPGRDGKAGRLTLFRESSPLPRIFFRQLGTDAQVTPLEVQDWQYDKSSYKIERIYHIKTKEIEFDFKVVVLSAEAEAAHQGRKWFVNLLLSQPVPNTATYTPLGTGVVKLRSRAIDWLTARIDKVVDRTAPLDLKDLDKTAWALHSPTDHEERRALIHRAFAGTGDETLRSFRPTTRQDEPGKWEEVDGRIRVYLMCHFELTKGPAQPPNFQCEAVVGVETKKKIDPATFTDDMRADWRLASVSIVSLAKAMAGAAPDQNKLLQPK